MSEGWYVRESLSSEGLAAGILDSTFNKCFIRKFPCPGIRIPANSRANARRFSCSVASTRDSLCLGIGGPGIHTFRVARIYNRHLTYRAVKRSQPSTKISERLRFHPGKFNPSYILNDIELPELSIRLSKLNPGSNSLRVYLNPT